MDPRKFQQAAREFFAADNALRAAPVPTEQHVVDYVTAKLALDAVIGAAFNDGLEEEEQDGSD